MNISRIFQYKCISNQIWPCHKKGQEKPRFLIYENKKEGKYQESIKSSTTPGPAYKWESDKLTIRHHRQEPGRTHIPNDTYQVPRPSEEKIYKKFLPYMGMVAILVM